MAEQHLTTRDLAKPSKTDATDTPTETSASGEPQTRDRSQTDEDSAKRQSVPTPAASTSGQQHGPLLPDDQSDRFTARWQEIQTSFVDQPRDSVEQADALVADLMQRLAASFSNERQRLEAQWDRGDDVSTEDLRVALTRYRSFFDRLLTA